MKKIYSIILILTQIGCTEKSNQAEFSYEEAIIDLQSEIKRMEDGPMKNSLLWKTERILDRDTLYKHKLGPYDSLMLSMVWDEYKKYPKRQLNLDKLELLSTYDRIEAYKFFYNRSFSDESVEITLSNQAGGRNTIKWQVFEGDRNCNPIVGGKKIDGSCFTIRLNEAKHLENEEWNEFKLLLEETGFWSLKPEIDEQGLDGSGWTIEGTRIVKDSSGIDVQITKSVYRWSPEKGTPIYKIGKYLLDMNEYDWGEIY